jgi:hypothetical protein
LIKSPQKPCGKNVRSMIGYAVKRKWGILFFPEDGENTRQHNAAGIHGLALSY